MELLPCPFCGGEAMRTVTMRLEVIACKGCHANIESEMDADFGLEDKSSIEKWNARHVEANTAQVPQPVSRTAEQLASYVYSTVREGRTNGECLAKAATIIQQALDAARADQHAKTWAMAMQHAANMLWSDPDDKPYDAREFGLYNRAGLLREAPCPPLEMGE